MPRTSCEKSGKRGEGGTLFAGLDNTNLGGGGESPDFSALFVLSPPPPQLFCRCSMWNTPPSLGVRHGATLDSRPVFSGHRKQHFAQIGLLKFSIMTNFSKWVDISGGMCYNKGAEWVKLSQRGALAFCDALHSGLLCCGNRAGDVPPMG